MKSLLLAAALIVPVSASAEGSLSDKIKALLEAAKSQKASQGPAATDQKPLSGLLDKVLREGTPGMTLDGPGVLVAGDAQGERLVLEAVEVAPEQEGEGAIRDLVYRRAFTHLIAVRQLSAPADGGFTRVENWVYRLGFEGSLYPVVHQVLFVKEGTGRLAGLILSDKKRAAVERQSPADPAVQAAWKDLAPRLLKLARTYSA